MKMNEHNQIQRDYIADAIRRQMKLKRLSLRKVEEKVRRDSLGEIDISYSQIARVTRGTNYTIDTLLTIIQSLDLEIQLVKKDD
jgi:transcriptional regulator with XRE-family HTH domain